MGMELDSNTILVLIGPHGSGKTTLARRVASALGWPFEEELGEDLRRQALAHDGGAHAMRPQEDFDRRVTALEIQRDLKRGPGSRVIETWHPGNLAYARLRSSGIAPDLEDRVRRHLAALPHRIWVQPLTLSDDALITRRHEPGPPADAFVPWLQQVGQEAQLSARRLGLLLAPPLETDQITPDGCVERILKCLDGSL